MLFVVGGVGGIRERLLLLGLVVMSVGCAQRVSRSETVGVSGGVGSNAAARSCEVLITTDPPPATLASNTTALAFEMLPVRCEYTLPEAVLSPDVVVQVSLNGFEKDLGEDWNLAAPDTIRFRALEACDPGTRVVVAYSC